MLKRIRAGALAASLLISASVGALTGGGVASASTTAADNGATPHVEVARAVARRGATVTAAATQVEEGSRLTLTATITSPLQASKVTLQKLYVPMYYGDPTWTPVKTLRVHGKRKVNFGVVATGLNNERYRVTVTYKNAKPFTSKPVGVTVWRWIPLSEYNPYYETGGAIFGTTSINGHPYKGWGAATYSHAGAWESRFTPGRHCKAFQGVLGLGDVSADGSSGTINFTADDTVAYQSPSLTPGMDVPVVIPLPRPYRIGIQLFDTTPGGTTGRDDAESWPVIGDPALLCTGV
jgi:hypothetical protein